MTPEEQLKQRQDTLDAIDRMAAGLANSEADMTRYFHEDFVWRGNQGCGIKQGVEAFVSGWQKPFREAFTDRSYVLDKLIADGEWAACYGHVEGTHSKEFMGIPATGKRVKIPYMDFWHVVDGRIKYNPVSVDYASVLAQLGHDVFNGEGWEKYDGDTVSPNESEDHDH